MSLIIAVFLNLSRFYESDFVVCTNTSDHIIISGDLDKETTMWRHCH